jgi:uncharacterized membrane protein YkoI
MNVMNSERFMNIRIVVFSVIALAGTAGLLVTGLTSTGSEQGEHDEEQEEHEAREHAAVRSLAGPGDILSLEQILQNARQLHAGRALETELEEGRDGMMVYEVEILDANGEVWEMKFDARSGELLGEEQED